MKKLKIPNTITGCLNLLKETFDANYVSINKTFDYHRHSEEFKISYSVYVSDVCNSSMLKSFEAVRKYVELAILNKDGE